MSDKPSFQTSYYKKHLTQISLVDDIYDGVDTAVNHLQQFGRENKADYETRQNVATLDNFVFRTTQTIKNIIFRKLINTSEVKNKELLEWLGSIDLTNTIDDFGKQVLINRIKHGYTYVLVDSPKKTDEVANNAQAKALGLRPYLAHYPRTSVPNYKLNADGSYSQVSLLESYVVSDGKFGSEIKEQVRVLYDDGKTEIYRDDVVVETFDREVKEITLVKIGDDDIPPLYDMAKINVTQFNRNSELDNYTRVGGAPFLAVYGHLAKEGSAKTLGITDGLSFNDKTESGAEWIEMSGNNFKIIQERIDKHNEQMLNIAISFATVQQNNKTKTATQSNNEKTEDESKLVDYSTELEDGLNKALELMGLFKEGFNIGDDKIETNKDFDANVLTPEQANSYRLDYAQGIISLDRLWDLLEKGEYLPKLDEKQRAEEKTKLLNDNGL